jgi:hypothetical protein
MAFPSPLQLTVTTISGLHKRRTLHLAHCTCNVTGDSHHNLRTSQVAEFPPCTLYLYCHSWPSPRSPDFTKGFVSTLHAVPVSWELTVLPDLGLHRWRSFHLAQCTCTVTADGHHDLRTSQKAEFLPCTLYLYRESWRVTTISGLHRWRSFHLAHCTCTVTADGHHDLRTSQKTEFPPCSLYLYCHSWWSPRSPDFAKGRVSTLQTVPVLSELTVNTMSGLQKRHSFHLADCTCTVTAHGQHDLRTSQKRCFHPAHYTCCSYVFFSVCCTADSVKQRMQNLKYYCRPRRRILSCARELMPILSTVSKLIRA